MSFPRVELAIGDEVELVVPGVHAPGTPQKTVTVHDFPELPSPPTPGDRVTLVSEIFDFDEDFLLLNVSTSGVYVFQSAAVF